MAEARLGHIWYRQAPFARASPPVFATTASKPQELKLRIWNPEPLLLRLRRFNVL